MHISKTNKTYVFWTKGEVAKLRKQSFYFRLCAYSKDKEMFAGYVTRHFPGRSPKAVRQKLWLMRSYFLKKFHGK